MYLQTKALAKVDAIQCNRPHDSRVSLVKGFAVLSGLVGVIMISLRVFARLTTFGHLWMDDWCHVLAGGFAIPFTVFACLREYDTLDPIQQTDVFSGMEGIWSSHLRYK